MYSQSPTPIVTLVHSPTPSIIPTPTLIIIVTPTQTPTLSPTSSPLPTPSYLPTPTPTIKPLPIPTSVPSLTLTPILTPASSPYPTPSLAPLPTTIPINIPSPISTIPSSSPTPIPSLTIIPSVIPSPFIFITPTLVASPSISLAPTPTPEPIGNDISYPQCNLSYPAGQLFGIVGVNGGIASNSNPCLASELSWAAAIQDTGISQVKIQLYVNTGNPGGLNTVTWPQNNIDPQGNGASNPYGICDGSNSISCAWQYGWNRAVDDVVNRFIPGANSAGLSTDPANYPWWLDVETTNSWRDGSTEALQANASDLEGMVAYLISKGITPGLYSTNYQWGLIMGSLSPQSSLNGLPNWLPGAHDLIGAKSNCQKPPFTTGSNVILAQFTTGNFDYDYSCK